MGSEKERQCWVCGGRDMVLVKPSNISGDITSRNFAITDSHYGVTGNIYRCAACGFMQCGDLVDVLGYYEELKDVGYEDGRRERSLQQRKLLEKLRKYKPSGRLLDVGAGSGMLVEQALAMGYEAEGVEPSQYLQALAREAGLAVHLGTFPHRDVHGPYDVVTLVDVLEHVSDPVGLLSDVRGVLADNGVGMVVTPNVRSLAALLMGFKWWHYRIAHIGYFDRKTLQLALKKAGLKTIRISRPGWYFSVDYLATRLKRYLPGGLGLPVPNFLKRVSVPLNLLDSFLVVFEKGDI